MEQRKAVKIDTYSIKKRLHILANYAVINEKSNGMYKYLAEIGLFIQASSTRMELLLKFAYASFA